MNRYLASLLIAAFVWVSPTPSNAQLSREVTSINEYVHFLNESIHGLLISHRLLENYNQEVNKYVDLDSYIINNFSNADLPADIFTDPEDWFYEISPQEWQEKITDNSALLTSVKLDLVSDVKKIREVLSRINQLRFDVENLIATKNLNVRTELSEVYEKLEQGEADYEEFYQKLTTINNKLIGAYKPFKADMNTKAYKDVYQAIFKIYMTTRLSLINIRAKNDEKLSKFVADLDDGIRQLESINFDTHPTRELRQAISKRSKENIITQARAASKEIKAFVTDGSVPKEFTNHGRYYYYYNSNVINYFNRYGNGMVFEMNRLLDIVDAPTMRFLEMPHYYKVIYPEKVNKNKPIAATNPNIESTPTNIKAREVVPVTAKIKADSLNLTIEIFDSKIKDGDIISFNYNKDWLLNKQKLSDKPLRLKLKLNEQGKNFFILHSDDMGRNPPTTIGIRYSYKGETQLIKLSSNLHTSEMIEIEYVP